MKKETYSNELGKRLKNLRGEKNQSEIAQDLGISRVSLGYYENGERKPDAEIIMRMCSYFHVSADYLLGVSDVKTNDMEKRALCEKTGLNEIAIDTLIGYKNNESRTPESAFDSTPMYCKLLIETLNNLLFPSNDLLDYIMLYIYSNFENYYDDYNVSDENEYPHISEIGFFDKKLGIGFHEDYSFLSSVFLAKAQSELIKMRETYSKYSPARITPIARNSQKENIPFE